LPSPGFRRQINLRVEPAIGVAKVSEGRVSACGSFPLHRLLRLIFLLTVASVSLKSTVAAAGLDEIAPTGEATFYEYKGLSPVVEVHAANIFSDYEHWGFFRIGILPMAVADHVQVKIQSAQYLTNALAEVKLWHQASRQLEIRNLEIWLCGEKEPRLRAALARIGRDGALKLSDVTFSDDGGGQRSLPKATMQIGGPSVGYLSWDSKGHREQHFVFQILSDKKP